MCRQLLGILFLLTHKLSDAQFAWIHTGITNSFQSVHSYTFTWHTCNHAQITKRALAWKNELNKIKREGKKGGLRDFSKAAFECNQLQRWYLHTLPHSLLLSSIHPAVNWQFPREPCGGRCYTHQVIIMHKADSLCTVNHFFNIQRLINHLSTQTGEPRLHSPQRVRRIVCVCVWLSFAHVCVGVCVCERERQIERESREAGFLMVACETVDCRNNLCLADDETLGAALYGREGQRQSAFIYLKVNS